MTVKELLQERGLTSALIVDDAYDPVPTAEDLSADDDAWANFFSDLGSARELIAEAYPNFEKLDATELRRDQKFVATLWNLRPKLDPALWNGLFERYLSDTEFDNNYLQSLESALHDLGVHVIRSGRNIPVEGRTTEIIFADLFLGSGQIDADMEQSISRLRDLLVGQEEHPPIVVLMSRSSRLEQKKSEFRDRACLLGTMFRVHTKQELLDRSTLDRTLERLAGHFEDAQRLAEFLHAWNLGLTAARDRFLATIRRLDLSDYAQVKQLLLDFEGQPLGSYLLDIFGEVLSHEVEADSRTIAAAEELRKIDTTRYPAPYIPSSPDLQDLVYKSIYQHPERLRVVATECGAPVAFGDILIENSLLEPSPTNVSNDPVDGVLVVLSPACDLARLSTKRVMLMSGALEDLTPAKWTYKAGPVRTPIISLPNGRRGWIRWDLKNVLMMTPSELAASLGSGGRYRRVVRLRDSHALELQQKVLSDMGRVGVFANMPATFPVTVEAFTVDTEGKLKRLATPTLDQEGGTCFAGRDEKMSSVSHLVMSENACDELLSKIVQLHVTDVHLSAGDTLNRLKSSPQFALMLERGLSAPDPTQRAFLFIKATSASDGQEETLGLIARNPSNPSEEVRGRMIKDAALILVLRDLGPTT